MKFNGFIFTIIFSSLIFTVLPLPDGSIFSIDILVLLLISLSFHYYKDPPGLWLAWFLGLLQDVFLGALLGEHALALAVTHFMICEFL